MNDSIKKALIVDDEFSIRKALKVRFEADGFKVITAANGKIAVKEALSQQPDVILLDLMMPEMDGYETFKMLKQDVETKHIPVIVFTAKGAEDVAGLGPYACDVVDFVVKPFDGKALELLVARAARLGSAE